MTDTRIPAFSILTGAGRISTMDFTILIHLYREDMILHLTRLFFHGFDLAEDDTLFAYDDDSPGSPVLEN